MAPHEVLVSVTIPFTRPYEYVLEFKQSPRRDDDIAIVNAGIRIALQPSPASPGSPGGWVVADAAAAFGGVAAKTIMAPEFAKALVGKEWNEGALEAAMAAVRMDVAVGAEAPGGRSEYRWVGSGWICWRGDMCMHNTSHSMYTSCRLHWLTILWQW